MRKAPERRGILLQLRGKCQQDLRPNAVEPFNIASNIGNWHAMNMRNCDEKCGQKNNAYVKPTANNTCERSGKSL